MALSRNNIVRFGAAGVAACLMVAAIAEAASILVFDNFHELAANRVYRSAQLSPADLCRATNRYGIKTVFNLRGCCPNMDWYVNECRTTASLDIAQEDITLSAGRLPAPYELKRLIEALDRAKYPILVHCRRGVDRTGLTCALIEMLYEGSSPDDARSELSYRHGHFPWGRTGAMLQFIDLYEEWLSDKGTTHSPGALREFLLHDYRAGPGSGHMELAAKPDITAGKPGLIRLKATNTSNCEWNLRPGTATGVYIKYWVRDDSGRDLLVSQSGFFSAIVRPGESFETNLSIPRLPRAGVYGLQADLFLGPDGSFAQLGNDLFATEFTAK